MFDERLFMLYAISRSKFNMFNIRQAFAVWDGVEGIKRRKARDESEDGKYNTEARRQETEFRILSFVLRIAYSFSTCVSIIDDDNVFLGGD